MAKVSYKYSTFHPITSSRMHEGVVITSDKPGDVMFAEEKMALEGWKQVKKISQTGTRWASKMARKKEPKKV